MSTETSERWRLFLALPLPETVRAELARAQEEARKDPALLPSLREACGDLAARASSFRLQASCCFTAPWADVTARSSAFRFVVAENSLFL